MKIELINHQKENMEKIVRENVIENNTIIVITFIVKK